MSLGRLGISNIRNIKSASLELVPGVNLILGPNGSGKTSLLEAVYFLGSARTFRSASVDPLITRGETECTVFGAVYDHHANRTNLGVKRDRTGGREIKVNGAQVHKASQLARKLPTLVLGPNTVELITGPPGSRRKFLNWGVFHVEPSFVDAWEQANRCLRQRNELLRTPGMTSGELRIWNARLDDVAERIHRLREQWFGSFQESFADVCGALTRLAGVTCTYYKGWDGEDGLAPVLERQASGDLQRGYTQSGHHRAELRLRVGNVAATSVCSRGELKILAWAMVLGQGRVYTQREDADPVYLVDDLASELDDEHQARVCDFLSASPGQVLATGVDESRLAGRWRERPRVFHVERGSFSVEEIVDERR